MFHIFRIHALMDGWIEWVIECAPWLFLCFFEAHYCLNIRLKKRTSLFTPHSLVIQVPDNQIIFVTFVEGARARVNKRTSERTSTCTYCGIHSFDTASGIKLVVNHLLKSRSNFRKLISHTRRDRILSSVLCCFWTFLNRRAWCNNRSEGGDDDLMCITRCVYIYIFSIWQNWANIYAKH